MISEEEFNEESAKRIIWEIWSRRITWTATLQIELDA